jgi:hypothetical protein
VGLHRLDAPAGLIEQYGHSQGVRTALP